MGVGEKVTSAFNGPADLKSFDLTSHELTETTIKKTRDTTKMQLEAYYQRVREYREGTNTTVSRSKLFAEFRERFPQDWLLPVELYELAVKGNKQALADDIAAHLETVKEERPEVGHLIDDGLSLAQKDSVKA